MNMNEENAMLQFRQKYGLTQSQLAQCLSTNQSTVARWESGESPIKGPAARLFYLLRISPAVRSLVGIGKILSSINKAGEELN